MVNFVSLAAEIVSLVWGTPGNLGTPGNFNGFRVRVLAALLHGTQIMGVSQTAALNRGRHLYSAGRPSRRRLDVYHTSTRRVTVLPYCEFRCRSETCFTRLAQNTGGKNRQKFAICTPSHNFVGLYLRNLGTYRQSKKNLLNSNISTKYLDNMVNIGPLPAEISSVVWCTPGNFNGFRVLAAYFTAWHSSSLVFTQFINV